MKVNLGEALHMLAGSTFTATLAEPGGLVDRLLQSGDSNRAIIEDIYLSALSRFPSPEEESQLDRLITQRPSRREAIIDLLWGVIASREFSENH